jgi:tetratricopeptide (TPR) repeat protein
MTTSEFRLLIEEGRRYEAAGSHDRALSRYTAAAERADNPAALSESIRRQSDIHRIRSEWAEALAAAEEAERIATDNGLKDLAAEAVNAQGAVFMHRGERKHAEEYFTRTLEISSHPRVRGLAWQNLGILAAEAGDPERAAIRFKDAYEACKEADYERGMLIALLNYARAVFDQGKIDVAERLLHEAEVLAINRMDLDLSHAAALNRAEAMITRGAFDEAETLISAALGYYGNTGNPLRRLDALRLLGDISHMRGSEQQARMFYEAARDAATRIDAASELDILTRRIESLES